MTADKFTIRESFLDTEDGKHKLYMHEWGSPNGVPIIYLHGGPGSGCSDSNKSFFDPAKHRVIFFDQRGAGKSTPAGLLEENTTQKLVNDIEQIRKRFGIEKFVVTGGSWGSTLALMYAISHPQRVSALIIRGIFLGTKEEGEWITKGGFRNFFPELWENFTESVPADHRNDPSAYHFEKAFGNDEASAKRSIYEVGNLEYNLINLDDRPKRSVFEEFEPGGMKIEMYYIKNDCFLPNGYILNNADKLTMPVHIIQGRYDMVCRPIIAHKLHGLLKNSELYWSVGGHSGSDRANFDITKTLLAQFS